MAAQKIAKNIQHFILNRANTLLNRLKCALSCDRNETDND